MKSTNIFLYATEQKAVLGQGLDVVDIPPKVKFYVYDTEFLLAKQKPPRKRLC